MKITLLFLSCISLAKQFQGSHIKSYEREQVPFFNTALIIDRICEDRYAEFKQDLTASKNETATVTFNSDMKIRGQYITGAYPFM